MHISKTSKKKKKNGEKKIGGGSANPRTLRHRGSRLGFVTCVGKNRKGQNQGTLKKRVGEFEVI